MQLRSTISLLSLLLLPLKYHLVSSNNTVPVRFNPATYSVIGERNSVAVTLEALAEHDHSFTVIVATRDGSAIDGADYEGFRMNVNFPATSNNVSFNIVIHPNQAHSCPVDFFLDLEIPSAASAMGVVKASPGNATVLIADEHSVPCQVTGVTLKPEPPMDGKVSMLVTWTAPRSYANISMYYVQYKENKTEFWGSQTVVAGSPLPTCSQLKGLKAGTVYDVRVQALSTAGEGPWSAAQTGRTYGGPSRVTSVCVTKSEEENGTLITVNMSWTPPQSDLPITEYEVEYQTRGMESWINATHLSVMPPANYTTLTGLDIATEYRIRVRALSEAGTGEWEVVQLEKMCTATTSTTSSQSLSPSPTVEPMSQECVGVSQEAAGRQDTSTAAIAASALLAVLFLLTLLISSVLVLWVVRLNKQLASVKGSVRDQSIQLTNVHTVRNDLANNPVYDVPNQPTGDRVVYEVMASEDVHAAPVLTAFASDHEGYSRMQRDSSVVSQSTTSTTGDGHVDVEAFYGNLDNTEQYKNSAVQRSLPTSPYLLMSVPTKEQREWLASQGGTASNGDNPYAALDASTISDDRTYWSPGATENEIYGQMSQNKYQELPRSSVHLGEALGEGEFGDVYRGEWQSTMGCVEVAVKVSKNCLEPDQKLKLLQEAAVMGQFLHPRVVRLFGVVTVGEPYMMVMECLHNGNLLEHLLDLNERSPKESDLPKKLLQFCLEIADGMSYLSKKGFIHHDLAARNILLDKRWRCKISNFGMSRDVCDNYYHVSGGRLPLCWTAPEAVLYRKYTTKSDVWSYGMVMYEIWSLGHKPFEDMSVEEVIRVFASGFCLSPPPGCPRGVYLLMVECWNPDPAERPVFNKLMTAFLSNPSLLLKWTATDLNVSIQASMLGAPLEEGKGLYTTLQFKYRSEETDCL